ncbi:MAG TPA: haloacid dehalogenase-like hydrolase [Candidatus Nanoarchaeia archaeon]|nr:haloacid dehalogenase-like hydrolase [Candidatus Nanoarchaeia archaeon]
MEEVKFADEKLLNEKIKKFKKNNFHVVADFDGTLTKAFVEGQKTHTTIAQIRQGNYLTPDYSARAHALFDEYHPYEISLDLSLIEKCDKMLEWWRKHMELMIECGMNKEVILDIIEKKKIVGREGLAELLNLLAENNIPLLIISAGLGDIIKEYLESEGIMHKNIHIISNFYNFDSNEKVIGYKSQIIHSYNKNEVAVKSHPYYEQIKERKNVILLGDSLGDLGMIEGITHEEIIRIGFFNYDAEEPDEFLKSFDAAILNDGTMGYLIKLVKEIFNTG